MFLFLLLGLICVDLSSVDLSSLVYNLVQAPFFEQQLVMDSNLFYRVNFGIFLVLGFK